MGVLARLFRSERTFATILGETRRDIFQMYAVARPSDAQQMRAAVYLCIAGMAILNDLGCGVRPDLQERVPARVRNAIDKLVQHTKELTKHLQMRVSELSDDEQELQALLCDFPAEAKVNGSTTLNGLAAFEALYFTNVEKLMNKILSHSQGPFGVPGYASMVVADRVFGTGKSREHAAELVMRFTQFMGELGEMV
jgi:hypothetical protein